MQRFPLQRYRNLFSTVVFGPALFPQHSHALAGENGKEGRKKIKEDVYYGQCIKVYLTPDKQSTKEKRESIKTDLKALARKYVFWLC